MAGLVLVKSGHCVTPSGLVFMVVSAAWMLAGSGCTACPAALMMLAIGRLYNLAEARSMMPISPVGAVVPGSAVAFGLCPCEHPPWPWTWSPPQRTSPYSSSSSMVCIPVSGQYEPLLPVSESVGKSLVNRGLIGAEGSLPETTCSACALWASQSVRRRLSSFRSDRTSTSIQRSVRKFDPDH